MTDPTHTERFSGSPLVDQLWPVTSGIISAQVIFVAAKLGLADLLKDGPKSVDELAAATQTHVPTLYRVMRALASLGIFAETEHSQHFTLTPQAELLQSDTPNSLRSAAMFWGSESILRSWANILHSLQTGEPTFDATYGMNFFEYMGQHPDESAVFNDFMTSLSNQQALGAVDAYDFSDFRTIVDVGGGHGFLLATILKGYPLVKGILFDQPAVVEGAHGSIQAEGVNDRCQIVGGDFFTEVPQGGDAYILKYIIHDWDDERAEKILKKCREGITPKGKVLVMDTVILPGNTPSWGKLADIVMLALTSGGRERTEAEFQELFSSVGFMLTRIVPTKTYLSIVEGVPV